MYQWSAVLSMGLQGAGPSGSNVANESKTISSAPRQLLRVGQPMHLRINSGIWRLLSGLPVQISIQTDISFTRTCGSYGRSLVTTDLSRTQLGSEGSESSVGAIKPCVSIVF